MGGDKNIDAGARTAREKCEGAGADEITWGSSGLPAVFQARTIQNQCTTNFGLWEIAGWAGEILSNHDLGTSVKHAPK
jgi:hypothetical protein